MQRGVAELFSHALCRTHGTRSPAPAGHGAGSVERPGRVEVPTARGRASGNDAGMPLSPGARATGRYASLGLRHTDLGSNGLPSPRQVRGREGDCISLRLLPSVALARPF